MAVYEASNAHAIDPNGTVVLDVVEKDHLGKPLRSISLHVQGADTFKPLQDFANQWVQSNPGSIAPYMPPTLVELQSVARQRVLNTLNMLSSPILSAYPEAERAAWLAKEADANAFLSAAQADRVVGLAPMVLSICEKQYGVATAAERLQQVTDKATIIVEKAGAWRALTAYIEAVRSRYEGYIAAAADGAVLEQVVADLDTELTAAKPALGL